MSGAAAKIWVMRADDANGVWVMGDEETICDVLATEPDDVKAECFVGGKYVLLYSKRTYMEREESPLNAWFEAVVRPVYPRAPQFRGHMVLIASDPRDPLDVAPFLEACGARWNEAVKPEEEIPPGLIKAFSGLQVRP